MTSRVLASPPSYESQSLIQDADVSTMHMSINLPSYVGGGTVWKEYPDALTVLVRTDAANVTFKELAVQQSLEGGVCLSNYTALQTNNPLILLAQKKKRGVRHFDVQICSPKENTILITLFVTMKIGAESVCTQEVQIDLIKTKNVVVNFKDKTEPEKTEAKKITILAETFKKDRFTLSSPKQQKLKNKDI